MENRLKEILDDRGIKYGWLADQVEISRNTVTELMKGARPHLDLAYRIADALGLSVYDIWPR